MFDLLFSNAALFSGATLGGAVLLAIVAAVIGYVVTMVWPKQHYPQLFGFLAAMAFLGGLAAAGSTAAAVAIAVMLLLGAFALAVGIG